MALVTRNGLWLTRQAPQEGFQDPFTRHFFDHASPWIGRTSPIPPDGLVQAMASGAMRLAAGSNVQLYSAESNVLLGAQGVSNVLLVSSNAVTIHGDLRVRGAVDAVTTTELFVRDKIVRVAVPQSASALVAESDLDSAGLALAAGAYDKALLWRQGGAGALSVGRSAPYWEAVGGMLRLTLPARADAAKTAAGGRVGYAFAINAQEQLEIYKHWTDAVGGDERSMRVLCAGPPMAAAGAAGPSLPSSTNPYASA